MNIYIKTFNRLFYLDRCIRTIKFNVKNYESIIILDDGTLTKYKQKIKCLHPDVKFVCSNADDEKYQLLKQLKFDEIRKKYIDPAAFWLQVISQEVKNYFLLLEDDTWFIDMLDLSALEENLSKNYCIFLKLWWGDDKTSAEREVYKGEFISEGRRIDYYSPIIQNFDNLWKIWLQCMAVYQKSYWINSYVGINDGVNDENYQLRKVYEYLSNTKLPFTFAKTTERVVYQGWAATGRSDPKYYNLGLMQHVFLDCLNEAWYLDQFDVTESYPFDFSQDYLLEHFRRTINGDQISLWIKWRQGRLGAGYTLYYNE